METEVRARGLAGWARGRALGDSVSRRSVAAAKVPGAYARMAPRSMNPGAHGATTQRPILIASRQILKIHLTHSQQTRKHFLIASFSAVSAPARRGGPAPHLTHHRLTSFLFRTNKPHRITILMRPLLK